MSFNIFQGEKVKTSTNCFLPISFRLEDWTLKVMERKHRWLVIQNQCS